MSYELLCNCLEIRFNKFNNQNMENQNIDVKNACIPLVYRSFLLQIKLPIFISRIRKPVVKTIGWPPIKFVPKHEILTLKDALVYDIIEAKEKGGRIGTVSRLLGITINYLAYTIFLFSLWLITLPLQIIIYSSFLIFNCILLIVNLIFVDFKFIMAFRAALKEEDLEYKAIIETKQ